MAVRSPDERIDRLEQIVQIIAEDHISHRDDIDATRKMVADLAADAHHAFRSS